MTESQCHYMVRRLGFDEVKHIEDMQEHWPEIWDTYDRHREWLSKVIPELEAGARIAFGAFDYRSEGGDLELTLQGTIVAKGAVSGVAEAKNLIIKPEEGLDREEVANLLIEKVERFFARRGFDTVVVELPDTEKEQIRWFIDRDYTMTTSTQHRYGTYRTHYVLRKAIDPTYVGDPFDHMSVVRWLLERRLGWRVPSAKSDRPEKWEADDAVGVFCGLYRFSIGMPKPVSDSVRELFSVHGCCLVDLGYGDSGTLVPLIRRLAKQSVQLRYFVTFRELKAEEEVCRDSPVRFIGPAELASALGSDSSVGRCPVRVEEIAGVLLDIGEHTRIRIEEKARQNIPFAYFVASGLGLTLAKREERTGLIAVLGSTELVEGKPQFVVWGCSDIADVYSRRHECAFDKVPPSMRLWERKAEFSYYINQHTVPFSTTGHVPVFELTNTRLLDAPEVVSGGIVSSRVVVALGLDSPADSVIAAYIDRDTADSVVSRARPVSRASSDTHYLTLRYKLDMIVIEVLDLLQGGSKDLMETLGLTRHERRKLVARLQAAARRNTRQGARATDKKRPQGAQAAAGQTVMETLFGVPERSGEAGPADSDMGPVHDHVVDAYEGLRSEIDWYNVHRNDELVKPEDTEASIVEISCSTLVFLRACKSTQTHIVGLDRLLDVFGRIEEQDVVAPTCEDRERNRRGADMDPETQAVRSLELINDYLQKVLPSGALDGVSSEEVGSVETAFLERKASLENNLGRYRDFKRKYGENQSVWDAKYEQSRSELVSTLTHFDAFWTKQVLRLREGTERLREQVQKDEVAVKKKEDFLGNVDKATNIIGRVLKSSKKVWELVEDYKGMFVAIGEALASIIR